MTGASDKKPRISVASALARWGWMLYGMALGVLMGAVIWGPF